MRDLVCAVDVGTGSARAGIFDRSGDLLARSEHAIAVNTPLPDHAEHDSNDIWRAVCQVVRDAIEQAGASADRIAALGFDATCSLVVRGRDGQQISVSNTDDPRWDTIAWFDHRAMEEAAACSAAGHKVLDHLGGSMSPEMQVPKLMWLKRHRPQTWADAGYLFDLVDFLTWRATGKPVRSNCTLTSKWTYLPHDGGWQRDFLERVGVADILGTPGLADGGAPVGSPVGPVTPDAAEELGVGRDCVVGLGLIDAFAGALGLLGGLAGPALERNLALIAGTSSCVMGFAKQARHTPGVWGPYHSAALEGYWLTEAGQSASGALLDHIARLFGDASEPGSNVHERIIRRIGELRREEGDSLASGIHVLPDFHGNRSPLADPLASGVISGLTLDRSFDTLCRLYWRTAVSIALGVRQILDHLVSNGYEIEMLHVTGGHTRNPLMMELYRDATGYAISESNAGDAVLLGTAMVAASSAGWYPDLAGACREMRKPSQVRKANATLKAGYDRDYSVFLKMRDHRAELDALSAAHSVARTPGHRRTG